MAKVSVAADFVSSYTRVLLGNIILDNEETTMETEYLAYDSGVLFLKSLDTNLKEQQVRELLEGGFKEMEEVLKEYNILEHSESLKLVIVTGNCDKPIVYPLAF